jgi:GNAT superfamily N-acetyltransferase
MDIIKAPTRQQIQAAVEWLSIEPHPNLDLEYALSLILMDRIPIVWHSPYKPELEYVLSLILMGRLPQEQEELLAIAHTSSTPEALNPEDICGALIAGPDNAQVSLAGKDLATTEKLLSLVQARGCPRWIATSIPSRDWVRPLLLKDYHLKQEHNSLVMLCTKVPAGGAGRWAIPEDKPALQASVEANQAEQGIPLVRHDWDALIQQQRVAVLEHEGQIVAVMKRGATLNHGMVVGTFTFAPYRRRGFAKQLLTFLLRELFKEHTSVKLWVDDDNESAITLYKSLGFRTTGALYRGNFDES